MQVTRRLVSERPDRAPQDSESYSYSFPVRRHVRRSLGKGGCLGEGGSFSFSKVPRYGYQTTGRSLPTFLRSLQFPSFCASCAFCGNSRDLPLSDWIDSHIRHRRQKAIPPILVSGRISSVSSASASQSDRNSPHPHAIAGALGEHALPRPSCVSFKKVGLSHRDRRFIPSSSPLLHHCGDFITARTAARQLHDADVAETHGGALRLQTEVSFLAR